MSQHIWREMDICIMQNINNTELTSNEKDEVLIDKIAELERYVETFENQYHIVLYMEMLCRLKGEDLYK